MPQHCRQVVAAAAEQPPQEVSLLRALLSGSRSDKCTEGEACENHRSDRKLLHGPGHHRQQILLFSDPLVILAAAGTDAPEIKADRRDRQFPEGAAEGVYHLVLHSAAKLRVRVADNRKTTVSGVFGVIGKTAQYRF